MKRSIIALLLLTTVVGAMACTSAIVSGKLTANGRPLLWKNRDTGDQNNRVERKKASNGKYEFIAVFDSRDYKDSAAWMGFNEKGFAIMNTASYNLNNDNVKEKDMDKEGVVMKKALEECVTVDDFEALLKRLKKPLGVEANFGVIDAKGGAVYYEIDNWRIRAKYDVNEEPTGYRVVTNFTWQGREEDRKGVDRYERACELLAETCIPIAEWDHDFLINKISRSGAPILRTITTASIVFEDGVMWASLGQPDKNPYKPYTEKALRP